MRWPRAIVVLPLLVLLEAVTAVSHGAPWQGEWNWTLDYAIGSTALTGPLVAGTAAWFASRERERAVLNDSTARGWLVPARIAGGAVVVGVTGWLLGLGVAVAATASVPHGGPFTVAAALVVPFLFGFYAALGATVGHLVPSLVVVVLVPIGSFVLGGLAVAGFGPNVLRIGLTSGTLAGLAWDPLVLLAQAAVLIGAGAVLLLTAASRRLLRTWFIAGGVVLGVLLCVGGLGVLERHGSDSYRPSAERATACSSTTPQVCLAPSNRRALGPVSRSVVRAATVLREAGAAVPASYVAELPGAPRTRGAGLLVLGSEANRTTYGTFDAAHAVVFPEPCPAWFGDRPPSPAAFAARELIAGWTLRELGKDAAAFSPEADQWFRTTPADEQAAWVVKTFGLLRSCELAAVRMPWPPSTTG